MTKIGTETRGPCFRDIPFEDILELDGGSPFGVILRDGATVSDVTVRRMTAYRMSGKPYLHTTRRKPEQHTPPGKIGRIRFEDCPVFRNPDAATEKTFDIKLESPSDLEPPAIRNATGSQHDPRR